MGKYFNKLCYFLFFTNAFYCSASLPVHIGIQVNPNIHFIKTDSTEYVLKQTQWGTNVLLRIGFDITPKLSFGLGAGFGSALEKTDYGFYTYYDVFQYVKRGYLTQADKNFYKDFYTQNIKSNYFINPYFTYSFPVNQKCGFMFELGYRFQLTENIVSFDESINTDDIFYYKRLNFNEKNNSIYVRPTFYFDLSSRIRLSLNYLNFGYSFGKKADYKELLEEVLPHYLIEDPSRITLLFPRTIRTEKQNLFFYQSYINSFSQFEFLYGLSSLYLSVYVKI